MRGTVGVGGVAPAPARSGGEPCRPPQSISGKTLPLLSEAPNDYPREGLNPGLCLASQGVPRTVRSYLIVRGLLPLLLSA